MQHAPPKLPERYRDARLVARGGMGEVWRARDVRLGRDVALKRLVPGDGAETEAARLGRFEREARAIAQLSTHPNVVTVYDVGELDGQPFLALEWLPGGTLDERMRGASDAGGRLAPVQVVDWLRQVASALDAAHAAGIVHRDVKPGNILFAADDDARIGDFGIARWAGDATSSLTLPGSVIGTAAYMSPEQGRGEPSTARSDQYALLLIAYEALVGTRPFRREEAVAELAAHVSEPVPSAARANPALPGAVDAVFERALAKDPAARFASCSAAIDALDDALREPRTAPTTLLVPPRRRRMVSPRRAILAAIVFLLFAGGLSVWAAGRDHDTGSSSTPTDTTTTAAPRTRAATTTTAATTPTTDTATTAADSVDAAIRENDRAFELLQQGRFAEALPLAQDALSKLGGAGLPEAYANFNVAASLIGLGRCSEAIPYLDRSEQLQGQRDEIDAARAQAQACIDGASAPGGKEKQHGKHPKD